MSDGLRRWLLSAALVAVAAVWGGTFLTVQGAIESYPVWSFLGLRFAIATVAFVVLFPRTFSTFAPGTLRAGLLAGVLLTAGYVFQTLGLAQTTSSKAAFITGMFVVITPFMQAVVLRRWPRWPAWLGVAAATGGLWLLSGGSVSGWNGGDTLVLLCAVAYSAHMIVLGSVGRHDTRALTFTQLATVTVVCGAVGLATEAPPVPRGLELWGALLLTGVLASAVAFAVQTYAQKHLTPTRTALILICEPAFGGLFGAWLGNDVLGPAGWAGAGLIIAGMAASEVLTAVITRPGEADVLEPSLEGPPVHLVEQAGADGE